MMNYKVIRDFIYCLPVRDYSVLVMRLYLNKSHTDVAKEISVSRSLIYWIEARTIRKIQNKLKIIGMKVTVEDIRLALVESGDLLPGIKEFPFFEYRDLVLPKVNIKELLPADILNKHIDDLDISTYAKNRLKNKQKITIGSLVAMSTAELLAVIGLGRKDLFEIRDELNLLGISNNIRFSKQV